MGAVCRDAGVPFHSDACQSFGKLPLEPDRLPLDLLTINAHKLRGPQGVGALWVRFGTHIEPIAHGGPQELELRAGTLNNAGIVGFGAAAELADDESRDLLQRRRTQLAQGIHVRFPHARINGPLEGGLPHITSVTFPGAEGKPLFQELNRRGFLVSLGSACRATVTAPSEVLLATGMSSQDALSTLRISHGVTTTAGQIDALLDQLHSILTEQRGTE